MQFSETKSTKKNPSKFTVPAKVGDRIMFHPVPTVKENRVNLKCQCTDFRFVWEFPLFENKALIGRFRKYTRVPGSARAPRNPNDLMGFCKHVWNFMRALENAGAMKES